MLTILYYKPLYSISYLFTVHNFLHCFCFAVRSPLISPMLTYHFPLLCCMSVCVCGKTISKIIFNLKLNFKCLCLLFIDSAASYTLVFVRVYLVVSLDNITETLNIEHCFLAFSLFLLSQFCCAEKKNGNTHTFDVR